MKLEQFSVIVSLKPTTLDIGKNSSFSQLQFLIRDNDQYKNTLLSQLYQPPGTPFSQNPL